MNNKNTKIISIILLALLIGFLTFYFTKKVNTPVENLINQEQVSSDSTVLEGENSKNNAQVGTDSNSTALENNKKFNVAMSNALNASMKNNYVLALNYYNEALSYKKDDAAYAGMYTIYLNQKDWIKALGAVDKAIEINSLFGDYWKWKILIMDEGLKSNFTELKKVYEAGYPQIKTDEKVNLVTYFARVSAGRGETSEAIALWQKAIELNPTMKTIYQAEIDALKK